MAIIGRNRDKLSLAGIQIVSAEIACFDLLCFAELCIALIDFALIYIQTPVAPLLCCRRSRCRRRRSWVLLHFSLVSFANRLLCSAWPCFASLQTALLPSPQLGFVLLCFALHCFLGFAFRLRSLPSLPPCLPPSKTPINRRLALW